MNIAIQIKFEIYYSTMTKEVTLLIGKYNIILSWIKLFDSSVHRWLNVWIYYILYDKLLQKSVMATSRLYNTQRRKAPRHQH